MKRAQLFLVFSLTMSGQVAFDRLRQADLEPGNWLTYSGNYSAHRYSRLNQVTAANVGRMKLAWPYQVKTTEKIETTPLVVDGVMYVSEPGGSVTALDTRTARPLWRYSRTLPKEVRGCCGTVNRGVAILDDKVYVGTFDAHLVALDIKSGKVRWDVPVADPTLGHSITGAPLAIKDKIVVGMAGGEYGVRGFIDAYDARTGERAWRFWTVPRRVSPAGRAGPGIAAKTALPRLG